MIAPARRAATEVLLTLEDGSLDLASALAPAHATLADARDRALLTELVTGVQRWRLQLDFAIHVLSGRRIPDVAPHVLASLRLGLYQLRFTDRLPPSAVVNDAVEIVKRGPVRKASGFVNAVLRRALREGFPTLPSAPSVPEDDPRWREQALAHLSIAHSHPGWLVERWLDRVGYEATEAWLTYDNLPADVTLWTEHSQALAGRPTQFVPGGLVLDHGRDALPLLEADAAYAQDEASAAVGVAAAAVASGRVLDVCAAPGGKTLAMRPRLPDGSRVFANDLRTRRVALLAATFRRLHVTVPIVRSDGARLPFGPVFDTVLIDAPCSGLGTLRREPDIRWRRWPRSFPGLVAMQRALIDEGLRVLAPGGRLVYATCSSEPEENEDLIASLVTARPELTRVDLRQAKLPASMTPLLTSDGALRSWPHVHRLDAFYAVVLTRRPATA